MKIDVTQQLKELDGTLLEEPVARCPQCGRMNEGKAITLRNVAIGALMVQGQAERNVDGVEKVRRYQLALQIHGEDRLDLTPEDLVLIRERVAERYQPLVVGQVWEMLDPAGGSE